MAESEVSCSSGEEEGPRSSSSSPEMNAAVALAEFARIAIGDREWGRRRRRRERKRIKKKGEGVRPYSLDLNQNVQTELEEELCQNQSNGKIVEQKVNLEMNCEVGRSTPSCSNSRLSLTSVRGRTTDLTEAEKEAKRLRRILANRESARQTIRRRQALCEELTRKAAELSIDNENMKKEKELVLKEYLLLNDTNRKLKEKVAEKLKDEAMTQLELETPASSSSKFQPTVHQRTPFGQLAYPPIAESLYSLKTNSYSNCTKTSYQQGTPCVTTSPMSNFYAQPYMWFYPVIPQKEVCGSIKTCVSNGIGGDSHNQLGSPKHAPFSKSGTSYTPETTDNNLPSTVTEKSSCHPAKALLGSYALTSATELEFSQSSRSDPELRQESQKQSLKKVVDAATATEARRRRKELTNLKRSHGREPQLYF